MNIEYLFSARPQVILLMIGESRIQTGLTPKEMISTTCFKTKVIVGGIDGIGVSR